MQGFIRYYKWHLIFLLLVLLCVFFVIRGVISKKNTPDLVFGYAGTQYVSYQSFEDNKPQIELLVRDANEDGQKKAHLVTYTGDLQKNVDENFSEMVEDDQYDVFIASKETFESYEDKAEFESVDEYLSLGSKKIDTLSDSSGRVYAVSLMNNSYAKTLGFVNSDELYIAVSAPGKDGLTVSKKNARNVVGHIITEG